MVRKSTFQRGVNTRLQLSGKSTYMKKYSWFFNTAGIRGTAILTMELHSQLCIQYSVSMESANWSLWGTIVLIYLKKSTYRWIHVV